MFACTECNIKCFKNVHHSSEHAQQAIVSEEDSSERSNIPNLISICKLQGKGKGKGKAGKVPHVTNQIAQISAFCAKVCTQPVSPATSQSFNAAVGGEAAAARAAGGSAS